MRPGTRRHLGLFVIGVLASMLAGAVYGALAAYIWLHAPVTGAVVGLIHGFAIGPVIGAVEILPRARGSAGGLTRRHSWSPSPSRARESLPLD